MAELQRWDPFGDMLSLRQAMDRLFEDAWVRPFGGVTSGRRDAAMLPLDLREEGDDYILTAALPGVKPEDIDITVEGNILTIKGETHQEHEEGNYHMRERRYGHFYRQVALPTNVRSDAAQASFENGELMLRIPKAEEARARHVQIQGTSSTSRPAITSQTRSDSERAA